MPKLLSREEAIRRGLTRYFTGKPCVHGHIADRHVCNSVCAVCRLASNKKRMRSNQPKATEGRRRRRTAKRQRVPELFRKRVRKSYHKHKKRLRAERLLKIYGITEQQYETMLREQKGKCAICKEPPKLKRRLAVDHSHSTNKIRALLCSTCNNHLGI